MPHIVISCFKAEIPQANLDRIQQQIVQLLQQELGCSEGAVSVDLKQIAPERWKDSVYLPRIQPRLEALLRKPGYSY